MRRQTCIPALFLALLSAALATSCIRPKPTTPEFCQNPPVVSHLHLPAYTGRWFNAFVSGTAREFALPCVTANYTLRPDGAVDVLNCNYQESQSRPACLPGVATLRPGLPSSRLLVSFRKDSPGSTYNVAALLGQRNYGYFAAAVYSCSVVDGLPVEGMFIIVRTPFMPKSVLNKLRQRLMCKGFFLEKFVATVQNRKCQYFDTSAGFDTFGPSSFRSTDDP